MALITASFLGTATFLYKDSFVEASDTALGSHTPTGPNPGAGWNSALGTMSVIGGGNYARDTNSSTGNRFILNNNLYTDQADYQVTVTKGGTLTAGDNLLAGVSARNLTNSSGGAGVIEFIYDFAGSQWNMFGTNFVEAWPGGSVVMKLSIRGNVITAYGNGVQKIQITNSGQAGSPWAGIIAGNFSANNGKWCQLSSFSVQTL